MPTKSSDDYQRNSRVGAFAESLVQTFLLEYCDFCFPCQDKHPADLVCELGPAMYTVQVKARSKTPEGKYVFVSDNSRNQAKFIKITIAIFLHLCLCLKKGSYLKLTLALKHTLLLIKKYFMMI